MSHDMVARTSLIVFGIDYHTWCIWF